MTPAQRAETWAKISSLLREYEDATQDAVREAIARQWEELRTRLQVVALTEGEPSNGAEVG